MARSESDPIRFCRTSRPVPDINTLSRKDPFPDLTRFQRKTQSGPVSGISEAVQAGRVLLARSADIE